MTTLLLLALLVLAALAGAQRPGGISTIPAERRAELQTELVQKRQTLQTIRERKCYGPRVFRWKPWQVPDRILTWLTLEQTPGWVRDMRARPSNCEYARALTWHRSSAASCVRSKEGGLTSVNPAGPYYGWYQTDPDFQRTYGREFVRAYGHGIWPARAQILTAYRGWRARGWYPWPNTARECGLI